MVAGSDSKAKTMSKQAAREFTPWHFGAAGLCQAAVQALKKQDKDVTGKVLAMLFVFFECLSIQSRPAAMAMLVEAGAVEITVGHIIEAGLDIPRSGLEMCVSYMNNPGALDRMCAPGMVEQLMTWFATRLPVVRRLITRLRF
jgi:hypothetical protein